MSTGWFGLIGLSADSNTATPQTYLEEAVPAQARPSLNGPLDLAAVDAGHALGLDPDRWILDPSRSPLHLATAQTLARLGRWSPSTISPPTSYDWNALIQRPILEVPDELRPRVDWRPAIPSSAPDAAIPAFVDAFASMAEAEDGLARDLDRRFPGGQEAYLDLLDKGVEGIRWTAAEQARLEATWTRIAPGIQQRVFPVELYLQGARAEIQTLSQSRLTAEQLQLPADILGGADPAGVMEILAPDQTAPADLTELFTRTATATGLVLTPASLESYPTLLEAAEAYARAIAEPLSEETRAELADYEAQLHPETATFLTRVLSVAARAEVLTAAASASLTDHERQTLQSYLVEEPEYTPPAEAAALLAKIDVAALRGVAYAATAALEDAVAQYQAPETHGGPPLFTLPAGPTPWLIVGSVKSEDYAVDTAILIDLGGDDVYTAPIGGGYYSCPTCIGAVPPPGRGYFHLHMDLAGDDQYPLNLLFYENALGGSGTGSVALSLEFSGNDFYKIRGGGYTRSLGAGMQEGVGAFADYEGDDTYDIAEPDYYYGSTLGAAYATGFGIAYEREGDDRYLIKTVGALGSGYTSSTGVFVDGQGDDVYDYAATTFGSVSLGTGQSNSLGIFGDIDGNDVYRLKSSVYGSLGYAGTGLGVFFDSAGSDEYSGGPMPASGKRGDGQTWSMGTVGRGVDQDLTGRSEGPDIQGRFIFPFTNDKIAPQRTVTMVVRVENRGDAVAEAVTGSVLFTRREGDTTDTQTPQMDFTVGDLSPGQIVDIPLRWTAPADKRSMYAHLRLGHAGLGDEYLDNLDRLDIQVERMADFRVDRPKLTESGLAGPDIPLTARARLQNFGNWDVTVPVTFKVKDSTGNPVFTQVVNQSMGSPGPVYDPAAVPLETNLSIPYRTPTVEGNYTFEVSIPATDTSFQLTCPSNTIKLCKERTLVKQAITVILLRDATITAESFSPLTDPGFFQGFTFKVLNAGTIPLTGTVDMIAHPPLRLPVTAPQGTFSLEPDQTALFTMPVPSPSPVDGEDWSFEGVVNIANDAKPLNNVAKYPVKFVKNVLYGDDFEVANPKALAESPNPCSENPLWQRGKPKITAGDLVNVGAHSGTSVWKTNLDGEVCYQSRHDLYVKSIDLTEVLAPVKMEFMGAIDSTGFSGYAYAGGYVAASPAGADKFDVVHPKKPYPCYIGYTPIVEEQNKPAFCGTESWTKHEIDLSKYAGQKVDVRFRYTTYCCYYSDSGWMIDDLAFFGTRRINGDFEIQSVAVEPGISVAGELQDLQVKVRNNGYDTRNVSALLQVSLGTLAPSITRVLFANDVPGGATAVLSTSFTPGQAKMYTVDAKLVGSSDPRVDNNVGQKILPVHAAIFTETLEGLPPCGGALPCGGWSHTGNEWELGTPQDFPGEAASGIRAWATDLDGPYKQGQSPYTFGCCYGDSYTYKLSTPDITVPGFGYSDGDQFAFAFAHAYDLAAQPTSTSFYKNQHDLAYVVQREGSELRLLHPQGGYPGFSNFGYCYGGGNCAPATSNPGYSGYTHKSPGYVPALFPLDDARPGETVAFDFVLWSHYVSNVFSSDPDGWTVDDIRLVRMARMDYDLELVGVSPTHFNASTTDNLQVLVKNNGRQDFDPSVDSGQVVIRIALPEGPIELSAPLPLIVHGESKELIIPFQTPEYFDWATIQARVDWASDEWNHNDKFAQPIYFGRIFYSDDFELGDGGWTQSSANAFRLGTPITGAALQGLQSWSTGTLGSGRDVSITGPPMAMSDASGMRLNKVLFEGLVRYDGKGMPCPYNGFRMSDTTVDASKAIALSPAGLSGVYYVASPSHCQNYAKLPFSVDLTSRQATQSEFKPRLRVMTYPYGFCSVCLSSENKGMEFDDIALYGVPYNKNVQLLGFKAPLTVLGPGEETKVRVDIINGGKKWPTQPTGLHLFSNDRIQGGLPSLDVVLPVPRLKFGESKTLETPWYVAPPLDGQVVRIRAQVVQFAAGKWSPLVDDVPADDIMDRIVTVVSLHDLQVDVSGLPNLDPDQAVPTTLRASISNAGTLTESSAQLRLSVLDEAGESLYEVPGIVPVAVPPTAINPPKEVSAAWEPPGPGHYQVRAEVVYDLEEDDLNPSDNTATAWLHLGAPAFRHGDALDSEASAWAPEAGILSTDGFRQVQVQDAPEGAFILTTNPDRATYEPGARYRYDAPLDLSGTTGPVLTFSQRYDAGYGDELRVYGSKDAGRSWQLLKTFTGAQTGWATSQIPLDAIKGAWAVLRFELAADSLYEGTGWSIDDVRVIDGAKALLEEDFEDDLGPAIMRWGFEAGDEGWSHYATPSDMDDWERGAPRGDKPESAHTGDKIWKTNLDGSYNTAQISHKYLQSPVFSVPAGAEQATFSWWQYYQIQFGEYSFGNYPLPGYSDGGILRVSVDGGPAEIVKPTTGYPMGVDATKVGSALAYSAERPYWHRQLLDMTPYKGHDVRVTFDFVVPTADAGRWAFYVSGGKSGWSIDDAALHVRTATTGEGSDNARLVSSGADIVFAYESNTAITVIQNEADYARTAVVYWKWLAGKGAILAEASRSLTLEPGKNTVQYTLPAVSKPQPAVLETLLVVPGDPDASDNLLRTDGSVIDAVFYQDFESPQDSPWPCGTKTPCAGWSHTGPTRDEWEHGRVPAAKGQGRAYGGDYAYGTDLSATSDDPDLSVEPTTVSSLFSPTFTVPEQGARLRFMNTLEMSSQFGYAAGGQVRINGNRVEMQQARYGNCGYPLYQPCIQGRHDWRMDEIDLNPWAGETIRVEFYVVGYFYAAGFGWMIDNFLVEVRPDLPTVNLAVEAPSLLSIDPRYPVSINVDLRSKGAESTPSARFEARFLKEGVEVGRVETKVPAMAPGNSYRVPVDAPAVDLSGAQIVTRILWPISGQPDHDPRDDMATIPVEVFQSVHWDSFEDGRVPREGLGFPGGFVVADVNERLAGAPSARVLAAGFSVTPLSTAQTCGFNFGAANGCHHIELPPTPIPQDGRLDFDQKYRLRGLNDGVFVEFSRDGGLTWRTLDPNGGYPDTGMCGYITGSGYIRCFTGERTWHHVSFPLSDYAGETLQFRFRYFRNSATPSDGGWALDNIVIRGGPATTSIIENPRWQRGPITNDAGPLEAISLPNAWSTGLTKSNHRSAGWDVLMGPVVDLSKMPSPLFSFEYWTSLEPRGYAFVQGLDPAGNWIELGYLRDESGQWRHGEYTLQGLSGETRLRFVYQTPPVDYEDPDPFPGVFLDNLLVGSLAAKLQRHGEVKVSAFETVDGGKFTVPILVTNTGAFTNAYTFEARGPDPYWASTSDPPFVKLDPGESRPVNVTVDVPYGGEAGDYRILIMATSLYDALQRAAIEIPVKLAVAPKPDWVLDRVELVKFSNRDGSWMVTDAEKNGILATVVNVGPEDSNKRPRIQFLEHIAYTLGDGTTSYEVRAINATFLPKLPQHIAPDTPFTLLTDWSPRKGTVALEVLVNPGGEVPEMSRVGNTFIHNITVDPRMLPELRIAAEPALSRAAERGTSTLIGIDVENVGGMATVNPVDVLVLAGYEHATLTSPVVHLKGNDVLTLSYMSDLEMRTDAVIIEARPDGGAWTRLTPVGGYPHGCVLALECASGISGTTDGRARDLTFKLRPLLGPTQFRLVFGMDGTNGRVYDGFQVDRVVINHFRETLRDFDFSRGSGGWEGQGAWTFRTPQGPLAGVWQVPPDYKNPHMVGVRQIPASDCKPCLNVGALAHADLPWTPDASGDIDFIVYVDPQNLEPEFLEDQNRFKSRQLVLHSELRVAPQAPIVLPNATAQLTAPIVLENLGNYAATFRLAARPHPSFGVEILSAGHAVENVLLEAGQSLPLQMRLKGEGAPAGPHIVYVDLQDTKTGRTFGFGIPLTVNVGVQRPDILGDRSFTVRQSFARTIQVENHGNGEIPIVLRLTGKPNGLAARVSPDEFRLAPFESRSVEIEFVNLGVVSGDYTVGLLNAAYTCPPTDPHCARITDLRVRVLPYAAPVAKATAGAAAVRPGEAVAFQDASMAEGAPLIAWSWKFGDQTSSDQKDPIHVYSKPGVYEVRLRVTNADGQVADAPPLLIVATNSDPVAIGKFELPAGQPIPRVGMPINFTAADSVDLDGGIANVTWAFGDGNLANGINASHTYQRAAEYRVTLAVQDGFGAVNVGFLTIDVEAALEAIKPAAKADEGSRLPSVPGPEALLAVLAIALVGAIVAKRRR